MHLINPIRRIRDLWLARLLRHAATELRQQGVQVIPYTDFDTTVEFAGYLDVAARRFDRGDTSDGERLRQLFAPTCDWDNAAGSQNLGNLIFSTVNRRFRPKAIVGERSEKRSEQLRT